MSCEASFPNTAEGKTLYAALMHGQKNAARLGVAVINIESLPKNTLALCGETV